MKKLKETKKTNLLIYQPFLKNNYLKKKQFKLKHILFENQILYRNLTLESYVIELNHYKNIYLPLTLTKIEEISTIALRYKDVILFNYDLTYNILYQFNRIMFQIILAKKENTIKGRLLGGNWNNRKIHISILGFVFSMKPRNLTQTLNFKKRKTYNKYNKKGFQKKKINITRLINCYKARYFNFKVNNINKFKKKKKELSRISYLQAIFKNKKMYNYKFKKKK